MQSDLVCLRLLKPTLIWTYQKENNPIQPPMSGLQNCLLTHSCFTLRPNVHTLNSISGVTSSLLFFYTPAVLLNIDHHHPQKITNSKNDFNMARCGVLSLFDWFFNFASQVWTHVGMCFSLTVWNGGGARIKTFFFLLNFQDNHTVNIIKDSATFQWFCALAIVRIFRLKTPLLFPIRWLTWTTDI